MPIPRRSMPTSGAPPSPEMEREIPEGAKLLKPRIEGHRRDLRERGYVVACGLWSPHINGLAVPLWGPQYRTYVVVTMACSRRCTTRSGCTRRLRR